MRKRNRLGLIPIERRVLETVAEIIGPHSAARQALNEADNYKGKVNFYQQGNTIIVEKL